MEFIKRCWAEISATALLSNLAEIKKSVGNNTDVICVVKANAYGHGAVSVAKAIQDKVYGFAVATVKEAMELRNNGIDNFILLLGYACKAEYNTMIRNNITFSILTVYLLKVK